MGVKYKVRYSKESHGKTWYFCNTPHRFHVKCYTRTADTCCTHIHILDDQVDSKTTTNASDAPP